VSFDNLKHQDGAAEALRAALESGRLPHAFLFVGPRGVGKGLAARELAKRLLCESPRAGRAGPSARGLAARRASPGGETAEAGAPEACDACAHCTRVDRGTHPDVYWFRKEPDRSEFRISLVARRSQESPDRVVTETVALTPMEGRRTVTVLDDAEWMNEAAANALLKALEEPAPHAVLVLLCADASRLPGTILSRCQWVRFRPLPDAFVAQKVRDILQAAAASAENGGRREAPEPPPSDEEIAYAARFSGGSIERACDLVGSGLWDLKRDLVPRLATMDDSGALDLAERIAAWSREDAKSRRVTDESREETALRREAARTALAAVGSALRDALVLATVGPEAALVNADQREAIERLADWPRTALEGAIAVLADAQGHISRYVHTDLATENGLLQAARLRRVSAA
jgi:DNA polymerase III gamma/tau subunit